MYKLLLFIAAFLLTINALFAQVTLSGTSYTETFDGIGSAFPTGWSSFTGATGTTLGVSTTYTPAATSWATTTGNFRNAASADVLSASATVAEQSAATDRVLGVRQTGNFGDAGAAMAVQLANTTGLQSFSISLKLQSLDAGSSRTTTWSLQYGIGSSPTTFVTVATQNIGNSTFSNNTISYNFSTALDNINQPVWIRVVALTGSSGSGNRPTTGLDDFTLTYSALTNAPTLGVLPTSLSGMTYTQGTGPSAPTTFTATARNLNPANAVTVTPPANFEVSTNGTTYSAIPLSVTPATDGSLSQTIYVRLPTGLVANSYSGTVAVSSPDVSGPRSVTVSGTVYPAGTAGPCGTPTAISAIRSAANNSTFTATGRVISAIGTNIYIQDATGGILLYTGTGTTVELPELSIGDEVQVTGILDTYNTDRELKNFTTCFVKTTSPNSTPVPTPVTTATLCDHKGELVSLASVSIVSPSGTAFAGNTNYTLSDGTILRIQNGTDLVGATRPSGAVTITGVVTIFNGVCQLLPRFVADVPGATPTAAACPEVGTGGTSIPANQTLDIAWWNVEWLGNTGFGPTNEAQQQDNVRQQLQAMSTMDIFCLEEVTDLSKLDAIITTLNANTGKTYARACGEVAGRTPPIYYSHWYDIPEVATNPTTYAQRVCFVYNTSVVTSVSATQIVTVPGATSNWASGRFPLLMSCNVAVNGVTKPLKLVGVHAKSGSDASSYSRRQADFASLKSYLDTTYPTDNVLIMGDYNDDADQSIYVDATTSTTVVSSFNNFVSSPDYTVISRQLSNCNVSSTASYPDIIDHLTVSNEISTNGSIPASGISYIVNSVKTIRPIVGGTTTSDHFPVTARFLINNPNPVKLVSFTGQGQENAIALNWITASEENNEGFDVLKGKSATGLEKVGFVAGHSTTSAQWVYQYLDTDVEAGQLYYYQLKQKDVGGASTLSNIIAVRAVPSDDAVPMVYPNPSNGNFTLKVKDAQRAEVKLVTITGVEVPLNIGSKTTAENTLSVSPRGTLPTGMYYLQIQPADGSAKKIIKLAFF